MVGTTVVEGTTWNPAAGAFPNSYTVELGTASSKGCAAESSFWKYLALRAAMRSLIWIGMLIFKLPVALFGVGWFT